MKYFPLFTLAACILFMAGCTGRTPDIARVEVPSAETQRTDARQQRADYYQAARETLKKGYDRFTVIHEAEAEQLTNYYSGAVAGSSNLGSTSGGYSEPASPAMFITIRMFHATDPGAAGAIDARSVMAGKSL